jgi:starch synthase
VYAPDPLFQGARTVLTVHNIGYQGIIGAAALPDLLPLGEASRLDQHALAAGYINLLGTGLAYADLITTVSPTYAREIQSAEYGMGLESVLRTRSAAVVGILNGVDYDEWDPRHDRYLPQHFDADHLAVKATLKQQLLQRLGLNSASRTALIGIVSRLATQKGFDLLFEAVPRLMAARDFNLVALGSGEPRYEAFFARLQQLFPTRVHFHRGYSDELAHWIEAASDMFLMPSRYEPCGLNQMYSLRYGTIPIVRTTGGLDDTVIDVREDPAKANGIKFTEYSAPALAKGIRKALALFEEPEALKHFRQNAMAADFSWDRTVAQYLQAYQRARPGTLK